MPLALASTAVILAGRTPGAYASAFRYVLVHILSGVLLLSGIALVHGASGSMAVAPMALEGAGPVLLFLGMAVNAAIAAYYYLRVIVYMYMRESEVEETPLPVSEAPARAQDDSGDPLDPSGDDAAAQVEVPRFAKTEEEREELRSLGFDLEKLERVEPARRGRWAK